MRLQLSKPGDHPAVVVWPLQQPLADWSMPNLQDVTGLHRHEVRLVEEPPVSYVVKELPDRLAEREFRLLRELHEAGLPTVEAVGVVTGRSDDQDGLLITRFLDYSLPYRTLLAGRGLRIPYLGERLLDALTGLLVRLHLAGFFWGDCSLSNTLFRRDAGALSAFIIDLETGERHPVLTDGQRALDLNIATENVAGGLLDLQSAGRLSDEVDPLQVALAIEETYGQLWQELTGVDEFDANESYRVTQRLDRLHELGFDAEEIDIETTAEGSVLRLIPRVVEHGFHTNQLYQLTGLRTGENQARQLLNDIQRYGAVTEQRMGRKQRQAVIADQWLAERFEPALASIPPELVGKLEPAEIYHQILEHRWYLSEAAGVDVGLELAVKSYVKLLAAVPGEARTQDPPSLMLPAIGTDMPPPDDGE